jgi:1-acyl-sn-glycerol-3-phosphate acyltransferase
VSNPARRDFPSLSDFTGTAITRTDRQPSGGFAVRSRPSTRERATEPWYLVAKAVVIPPLRLWFRLRHEGFHHLPRVGPAIVACNHISYLDPLTNGEAIDRAGRRPRFLAKRELFRIPVVGTVLRGAGQIPVARGSRDGSSLVHAQAALGSGEVVVIYPEGTVTRRQDHLPMEGKTGVARLALATGVPVIPMASWGSQAVWQKSGPGSLRPGRPVLTEMGEPLDLGTGDVSDTELVRTSTKQVMAALTVLAEGLRDRYPAPWRG